MNEELDPPDHLEWFVTLHQIPGGGTALRPPTKKTHAEPDWELDHTKESVGAAGHGVVVVVVAYWKRPEPMPLAS